MAVGFFLVQVREFFLWHPGAPDSRASGRKLTAKSGPKQAENAIILRLFIQVMTKAPEAIRPAEPEADSAAHSLKAPRTGLFLVAGPGQRVGG